MKHKSRIFTRTAPLLWQSDKWTALVRLNQVCSDVLCWCDKGLTKKVRFLTPYINLLQYKSLLSHVLFVFYVSWLVGDRTQHKATYLHTRFSLFKITHFSCLKFTDIYLKNQSVREKRDRIRVVIIRKENSCANLDRNTNH